MNDLIDSIKSELESAALQSRKVTTFHFQVLKHASELEHIDKYEFCEMVGMKESFIAEFDKMMRLSRYLKGQDIVLAKVI